MRHDLSLLRVVRTGFYSEIFAGDDVRHFYKYSSDLEMSDVACWIVRRNLILADAAFSIAGNCR
jgi:hypothetical protein